MCRFLLFLGRRSYGKENQISLLKQDYSILTKNLKTVIATYKIELAHHIKQHVLNMWIEQSLNIYPHHHVQNGEELMRCKCIFLATWNDESHHSVPLKRSCCTNAWPKKLRRQQVGFKFSAVELNWSIQLGWNLCAYTECRLQVFEMKCLLSFCFCLLLHPSMCEAYCRCLYVVD